MARQFDVTAGAVITACDAPLFEGRGDDGALSHHGEMDAPFVVFWAYIGFSQYMLYWYANIPEGNAVFPHEKYRNLWNVLSTFLVIGRSLFRLRSCFCAR